MIVKNTSSSFALAVRFPQTVPDSTGFEDTGRKPGSLCRFLSPEAAPDRQEGRRQSEQRHLVFLIQVLTGSQRIQFVQKRPRKLCPPQHVFLGQKGTLCPGSHN